MLSWRSRISIPILLGVVLASYAQDPSSWHGRILGIEDSPNGQKSLAYEDMRNVSQRGTLTEASILTYLLDVSSATAYVSQVKVTNQGESGRSLRVMGLNNARVNKIVDVGVLCVSGVQRMQG